MISKINFQTPEKAIPAHDGKSLLIHSIFHTIQGEGPHAGKPSVFVRLGGCNLQCPGCDTEYTKGASWESTESIRTRIDMAFGDHKGARLVVITGGEPFRQNLFGLINSLHESYIQVQIETNGTLGLGEWEPMWAKFQHSALKPQIVVSPKAGKVHHDLWKWIVAYKYVLNSGNIDFTDGLPTSVLGMPAAPARPHKDFEGEVYVQPAHENSPLPLGQDYTWPNSENNLNLECAVASSIKYGYRLCIQMHKIVGLD